MFFLSKYLLLNKKLNLFNPKKTDVLFFGKPNLNLNFKNKIKHFELHNQLYLQIFLKSFLKHIFLEKENIKSIYFKELMKKLDPKIVVGDEINENIFKFKKNFPKKKAICYQIVNWSNMHKTHLKKNFLIKDKKCDYFLLFNKNHKKYFKHIKAKFVNVGSFKNNFKPLKKKKFIYDILFISEYRPTILQKIHYKDKMTLSIKKNYNYFTTIVLEAIKELIIEKKLKLAIALSSSRSEKKIQNYKKKEVNFFKNTVQNFPTYRQDAYSLIEKSKVVVSTWSTLGVEIYAQKKKIMFITPRFLKNFNWSFYPRAEGLNWYQGINKKKIKDKIMYLYSLNEKKWKRIYNKNNFGLEFDLGNKKFMKIIYKELNINAK